MTAQAIYDRWMRQLPEPLTIERTLHAVAAYYRITPSHVRGHRRHRSLVWPRAVAMYLARTHARRSFPEIAFAFDRRHHTTVMAAVDKVRARLEERSGVLAEDIEALELQLGVRS